MGNLEWIITGFSIFLTIGGVACSVIIPILVIGGIGYFLYKRSQQSGASNCSIVAKHNRHRADVLSSMGVGES